MRALLACTGAWLSLVLPASLLAQEEGKPPPVDRLDELQRPAPADTDSIVIARPDSAALDTVDGFDLDALREELGGGDFPEQDADFRRLAGSPGFRVIEYRGEMVELEVDTETIRLLGQAQANYGGDVLRADTIAYLGEPQFIIARRNINLIGQGQAHVVSDSLLYYDVSRRKGTIFDAETEFAERGATWFVKGTAVPKGQDTVYVASGAFTSCEYDTPHYYFQAGRIKLVAENVIVAWPVVLYVSDVPVFWLPFFAQDIRPGRHSGLLPPRFGFNDIVKTSDSYNRQISDFGYYWAINEYLDAQGTIDWFSGNYTRLNGAFRYRFLKQFIRGNALASYSFGNSGKVWDIRVNHDHELSASTKYLVSLNYVNNTRLYQDQSFNPNDQTQTIDSNVGVSHRWPFASLNLSGRHRQFLGTSDQTETTLPQLGLALSPVTLFRAPVSRQGLVNNLTWNGSFNLSRTDLNNELTDDRLTTNASASSRFTLRSLNWTSSGRFNEIKTSPFDTLTGPLPDVAQSTINWNTQLSYQINLVGSTRLSPTFQVDGALFKSPDTGNDYLAAPTRINAGATLGTDIYGFLPGFGPFSRIRHKLSPSISWAYSPAVELSQEQMIPGFPVTAGDAQNRLSIGLTQTFEAKVRRERVVEEQPEIARLDDEVFPRGLPLPPPAEETPVPAERGLIEGPVEVAPSDSIVPPDSLAAGQATPGGAVPAAQRLGAADRLLEERKIVLLSWNITTPLTWDFERAKRNEPTLLTETFTSIFTSDLLRGLTINVTHDLFKGIGNARDFDPFLSSLSASFSIRSGVGLGSIVGVGDDPRSVRSPAEQQDLRSPSRLGTFEQPFDPVQGTTGSGPWDLSLTYSLARVRTGETGQKSSTISGNVSLQPTPNWRVRWSTQYNFTLKEFGQHLITLDRNLHHWQASFQFSKSPNGNVLFQFYITLRDAPEIKIDYGQQSETTGF